MPETQPQPATYSDSSQMTEGHSPLSILTYEWRQPPGKREGVKDGTTLASHCTSRASGAGSR